MGLFNSRQPKTPPDVAPPKLGPQDQIPVLPFDLTKRYDVYYATWNHDRLYENVRFVCIRTFDSSKEYVVPSLDTYLEIEAANGARCLIPQYGVREICEHGAPPVYTVLRRRRGRRED